MMKWAMPDPPPAQVLSVRDSYDQQWWRADDGGYRWDNRAGARPASWDWLVYHRGPLAADEMAA